MTDGILNEFQTSREWKNENRVSIKECENVSFVSSSFQLSTQTKMLSKTYPVLILALIIAVNGRLLSFQRKDGGPDFHYITYEKG